MNNTIVNNSLRFLFLIFLQVLFLNNINIEGYANVHLYVLFILLLPYSVNKSITLLLALLIGFVQDLFLGTLGLGMFCAVFVAFVRPYIIQVITDKKLDEGFVLNINEQGFRWFVIYMTFGFFFYYAAYFLMEIGTFLNVLYVLLKTIFSTIISVFLALLVIYTFYSKSERKY